MPKSKYSEIIENTPNRTSDTTHVQKRVRKVSDNDTHGSSAPRATTSYGVWLELLGGSPAEVSAAREIPQQTEYTRALSAAIEVYHRPRTAPTHRTTTEQVATVSPR